jgi:invasion protein IalB
VETEDGLRPANNKELAAEFQIKRCETADCAAELEEQERLLELMEAGQYLPEVVVTSTTAKVEATIAANAVPGMMQAAVSSLPTPTALETREQKTAENVSGPAMKTSVVHPRHFAHHRDHRS